MYTLVVVDMQPYFKAATGKRVRENCLREIIKAVEDNASIIFLEFEGYERTLPELMAPVQNAYGNYYVQLKGIDDGSLEVEETVRKHDLPKIFRVCGINTDCCVAATVRGLTARFPKSSIDVIADACDSDWNHMRGINTMADMGGNVSLKFKEENNV